MYVLMTFKDSDNVERAAPVIIVDDKNTSTLWLFRDKFMPGNTYTIPYATPALLSFDEQVRLAVLHTTVSIASSNVSEASRYFHLALDGDSVVPLLGEGGLSSHTLLPRIPDSDLSCHEGTITEVISSELAIYRMDDRRVLVASLLACKADLPLLAPGMRIQISRCHSVHAEDGNVHLVLCCASRVEVSTEDPVQAFYRPHTLRWLGSLHGTYPMVIRLLRTLQKLQRQFVPWYLSHADLVGYDTDAQGKRSHSLLFTLLGICGPRHDSRPARHAVLEFFRQPHDCGAILTDVLGCLGLSSEGTLHLCDATGTLRLQTLLPAARLPLGQVVLVGHESRLIFEEVAPLRDVDKRFGHVYLEANVITPVFPCEGCPHMPSEALSETGRQSVQLVSRGMPQTKLGKHSFQAQVRLCPEGPIQRILFGGLHWMPLLQRGEVYDIVMWGSASLSDILDNVLISVNSDPETVQAFSESKLPVQDSPAVLAIVIEKFYQEARQKQSGANTDGVCGLSPCLVVQLIPSLDSLTIYLNCMTAAVELVGIGPGTLVQLEGMSVNQSGRRNRYISAGADSSITILSWGEAKHVCKTRLGGKWPFPGGPCNGLAYSAPSAWHCCVVDKIEVTLSPTCDSCGRRKTCAPSCRPLGSVPRATAMARQVLARFGQSRCSLLMLPIR
ncbi:hypothetical protein HPB47_008818 [Ixodes persulcatus]|uniref:Uncharacterized protein n=1 Tax=Ixodes persulcatus TaxID=34615 RepID=A0AC60P3N9_IXOPE|nr:hypothetical protein HPB47_008818 [Ixodes persulcatus]